MPLIVLGRAGYGGRNGSSTVFRWGTWFLAALMVLGALLNFASRSRWENYLWGPYTVTLAILCIVVARRAALPRLLYDRFCDASPNSRGVFGPVQARTRGGNSLTLPLTGNRKL